MNSEQKEKFKAVISTLRAAAEHIRLASVALTTAACDLAELGVALLLIDGKEARDG